jgi:hypothetical protein
MVLIFGTKVVPVTDLYHYTIVFPPMSVRVNYFKYTTVGTLVSPVYFTDVYSYFFFQYSGSLNERKFPKCFFDWSPLSLDPLSS